MCSRMHKLLHFRLITFDKEGGKCFCPCSFVHLSVSTIYDIYVESNRESGRTASE